MAEKDLAVGGQALIEGVLMRGEKKYASAVRNPRGEIVVDVHDYIGFTKRHKWLNLPIIRGFINLIEMIIIGTRALINSAEVAIEDEKEVKTNGWEFVITIAISFGFSILLFIVLPALAFTFLAGYIKNILVLNVLEGAIRFSIFLSFLLLTTLLDDMSRVWEYHGAEHKVIHAYEAGKPLVTAEIKKFTTIHPRCGTSFLLVVMIISIFVFALLGRPDFIHRVMYKLMLVPLISGIAYEIIKLHKKVDERFLNIFLYPGLMMQKITTKEPDEKQIEVAVAALKAVL